MLIFLISQLISVAVAADLSCPQIAGNWQCAVEETPDPNSPATQVPMYILQSGEEQATRYEIRFVLEAPAWTFTADSVLRIDPRDGVSTQASCSNRVLTVVNRGQDESGVEVEELSIFELDTRQSLRWSGHSNTGTPYRLLCQRKQDLVVRQ